MTTYLVDGKAPGQFRARCSLMKHHAIADLPHYLRREYEEKGWKTGTRHVYSRRHRRDLATECFLEPLCEGFETTDPAAFVEHMKTVHGKREVKGEWEAFSKSIDAGWRGPRLTTDGKPWAERKGESLTRTCTLCGLVAEVDDRAANVLWWDEHERGCRALLEGLPEADVERALAQTGVSS